MSRKWRSIRFNINAKNKPDRFLKPVGLEILFEGNVIAFNKI